MPSRFTLLVIQPDDECPIERFGPWLSAAGGQLRHVRPYLGELVPDDVGADALLVLGGDMGANDDLEHPWLHDVRTLMARAAEAGTPTLGVCLGGQLLAMATGGTVKRGEAGMEAGVIEVRPRPEAYEDELMSALPWPMQQGSMHRDAITALPPSAVWLAESAVYQHQAFRIGRRAWGVQFHPELSPQRYRRWAEYVREDELTSRHISQGVAEFDLKDAQVISGAQALALAFASIIIER